MTLSTALPVGHTVTPAAVTATPSEGLAPQAPQQQVLMGTMHQLVDGVSVLMTLAEQQAYESDVARRQAVLQAGEVPQSVTMRQAKSALLQMGILDKVPAAIAAIEDAMERQLVQIAWDEEVIVSRSGDLAKRLERSFKRSPQQVDALFVLAATFPAEG